MTTTFCRSFALGRLFCIASALMLTVQSAATLIAADEAQSKPFFAGFAERDITPEIGMEQPGGYGKSFHRSLHDPCKVRAAVFTDGDKRVAIVGLDALFVMRVTVEKAREAIHAACGIEPGSILISASHSHSSGPIGMILPGDFDHASDLVQELAYEKSSCADPKYLKIVEKAIVDAVVEADAKKAPSACGVGRGHEAEVSFNRRFRMRSGRSETHPRQGNPNIIEPAGPIDPEVLVLGAWNESGELIGCIVNFACHATTNPGGISANYIYYIERAVRGVFGDDVVVVFQAAPSGDVTQVDNLSPFALPRGEDAARIVGGSVGAEAVKALLKMPRGALSPIASRSVMLDIPRRVPSPEHVQQAFEIVAQDPRVVGTTEWTFAKETVLLDARLKVEPIARVEIQAIQLGPVVFLSDPAEYFVEFGLRQKAESGFQFTFPVCLASGCVGYVPTGEALGPRGGGYETRLTSYSNLEVAAGDKICEAGLKLAHQLKPGPLPTFPPAPEFSGEGWTYGNLPAQVD